VKTETIAFSFIRKILLNRSLDFRWARAWLFIKNDGLVSKQ